jgi:hypothetical protein
VQKKSGKETPRGSNNAVWISSTWRENQNAGLLETEHCTEKKQDLAQIRTSTHMPRSETRRWEESKE